MSPILLPYRITRNGIIWRLIVNLAVFICFYCRTKYVFNIAFCFKKDKDSFNKAKINKRWSICMWAINGMYPESYFRCIYVQNHSSLPHNNKGAKLMTPFCYSIKYPSVLNFFNLLSSCSSAIEYPSGFCR